MVGAKIMCLDINNFYLVEPMDSFEYLRIPITMVPQEIIAEYNLLPLVTYLHVYIEVQKGMYGLPQAVILANQLLARYHQTKFTPGLWEQVSRPLKFTLVVDDFGVQHVGGVNMPITSSMLWSNPTQFPNIGQAVDIVALH
jgi:hypothetical protein